MMMTSWRFIPSRTARSSWRRAWALPLLLSVPALGVACADDGSSSDGDPSDGGRTRDDGSEPEPEPSASNEPQPEPDVPPDDDVIVMPESPDAGGAAPTTPRDAGFLPDASFETGGRDAGPILSAEAGASTPDEPDAATGAKPTEAGAPRDAGTSEETSDVDASDPLDAGNVPLVKLVFATSSVYQGGLAGVDGADELCRQHAAMAELDGTFRAWLSTMDDSVLDRWTQPNESFVRVDGVVVAEGWDDLVDGTLGAPINVDEFGNVVGGDVWTGTMADGTSFDGDDCDGFADGTNAFSGLCGRTSATDSTWTQNINPACSTPLRLFCFEQ